MVYVVLKWAERAFFYPTDRTHTLVGFYKRYYQCTSSDEICFSIFYLVGPLGGPEVFLLLPYWLYTWLLNFSKNVNFNHTIFRACLLILILMGDVPIGRNPCKKRKRQPEEDVSQKRSSVSKCRISLKSMLLILKRP